MSARRFCWFCHRQLQANRGVKIDHPSGEVEVHGTCSKEANAWIAESRGAGVNAMPTGKK